MSPPPPPPPSLPSSPPQRPLHFFPGPLPFPFEAVALDALHIQTDTPRCIGSKGDNTFPVDLLATSCALTPHFFSITCFAALARDLAAFSQSLLHLSRIDSHTPLADILSLAAQATTNVNIMSMQQVGA